MSMKTTTVKLSLEMPAADALQAGLGSLEEIHPPLREAQRVRDDAAKALAAAKATLDERQAARDRIAGDVHAGRAAASALDDAVLALRSAAVLIGPAEAELIQAEGHVVDAIKAARAAVLVEAQRRHAVLGRAALVVYDALAEIIVAQRVLLGQAERVNTDPLHPGQDGVGVAAFPYLGLPLRNDVDPMRTIEYLRVALRARGDKV